jgi:hypothetical protein
MPKPVDLGPCTALRHAGDRSRCAILLPGQFYPTRAPVLWFAREAAVAQGWSALEVLGEAGTRPDALAWERECAERALDEAGDARVLVIGKSLASFLAGEISDRGIAAAWLTPLLTEESVIEGLSRARRPTLVAGGTADPLWRRETIPDNTALEVLEVPDADHSLQVPDDPLASLEALRRLVDAVGAVAAAA